MNFMEYQVVVVRNHPITIAQIRGVNLIDVMKNGGKWGYIAAY
ncbi:hypothetical protein [Grimontia sp. AD028]|nr:hypothetical protein [Grimontia sp. AD028]